MFPFYTNNLLVWQLPMSGISMAFHCRVVHHSDPMGLAVQVAHRGERSQGVFLGAFVPKWKRSSNLGGDATPRRH